LVETPEQAGVAQAVAKLHPGSTAILALNPPVHYLLERQGVAANRLEDYHSEDELQTFGFTLLAVIDEVCEIVDETLLEHVEVFRRFDLKVGSLSWYEIKNLINSVAIPTFITRRMLEAEAPQEVRYFGTRGGLTSESLAYVDESPWPYVVPMVCNVMGVHSAEEPLVGPQGGEQPLRSTFDRGSIGLPRLRSLFSRIIGTRRTRNHSLPVNGRGQTLLVLSTGYSMKYVVDILRQSHELEIVRFSLRSPACVQPIVPSGPSQYLPAELPTLLDDRLRTAWERVKSDKRMKDALTFLGSDVSDVVGKRLHYLFNHVATEMLRTALQTEEVINRFEPAAMVATNMPLLERVAMHTARRRGVPTVVYQHGATGGVVLTETHGSFVKYQTDLRWSDWAFTFGDGDSRYYSRSYPDAAKPVSVGSAALDEVRGRKTGIREKRREKRALGLKSDVPAIFYVPTSMDGYLRPIPARNRSPSLMFEIERAIADFFSQFPDFQFVFKMHAVHVESPISRYIEDRGYSNCKVIRQPFRKLLHLADAFVADFPSTSFLEMLTTDRPILFCGHELPQKFNPEKWHPSILPMWKERVLYAEQLDEFLEMLRGFLRKGDFSPVKSSDEMLRLFGTHLDDGKSAERAIIELKRIIQTHAQTQGNNVHGAKNAITVSRSPKS
jgi:hypothetical protein